MIRRLMYWVRSGIEKPSVGYALLGLSIAISLTQVYYLYYNIGDEGDKLATGWLVAKGWVLYKDIFSHHFPLPSLWIAAIVKMFGPSILAIRLSLIILRAVVLATAMKASRYTFAIGLASLSWSLVGHLYLGNSVLYHSFSGLFILGGFAIGLSLVTGQNQIRFLNLFIAGLFLGFAILSDPLMAFPALVLIATVAIISFSKVAPIQSVMVGGHRSLLVVAGLIISILPILFYHIIHDSLLDFYESAIQFNSQIYSQYSPSINLKEILKPVGNFLGLFEEGWRYYLSPFYEWETFEFLDLWIFTGFFYRLCIFLVALLLLFKRKFPGAIFVFLFGAMVLVRSERYFHASPFVLLSLFCSSWMISQGFGLLGRNYGERQQEVSNSSGGLAINIIAISAWIILMAAFSWLIIRSGKFLINKASELGYSSNFSEVQGNADFLSKATCGLEEARVLIYPLDPVQYFLAELPPASKYHFMTPWVADIAQKQVMEDLEMGINLVYINRGTNVWGYQVEEYLSELLDFLDGVYVQIEPNYYASPDLLLECPYIVSN